MRNVEKCCDRNPDALMNATLLRETCLHCGRKIVELAQDDFDVLYAVCQCGQVIPCKNAMVWH